MSTFFGLTSDYKPALLEEIYVVVKYINISHDSAFEMPTYRRKYFLELLQKDGKIKSGGATSTGKGKRVKKITDPEAVKDFAKKNQ